MTDTGYELVAFKGTERRCFQVVCDAGLEIQSVTRIKPAELSKESQAVCNDIMNETKEKTSTETLQFRPDQ